MPIIMLTALGETSDRVTGLELGADDFIVKPPEPRELVALAEKSIAEVKESGESLSLEAMSAFERKVVHDAVAAAGLTSESEGAEPKRHVVILPA